MVGNTAAAVRRLTHDGLPPEMPFPCGDLQEKKEKTEHHDTRPAGCFALDFGMVSACGNPIRG